MPDLTDLPRTPASAPPEPGGLPAALLARAGAAACSAASLLRGERIVHARGVTVAARLLVVGGSDLGAPLFDEPGQHRAVVRFSRAIGLPEQLPDVLGIAVRVLDAHGAGRHQDLLLHSTTGLPVLRRLPLPRRDLLGSAYSSVTDYQLGRRRCLLAVLPDEQAPRTASLSGVAGRGDGARLLLSAATGPRRWRTLGVLELDGPVPHGRSIRFSPDNTGGGIHPVGWLQDLRRDAYRASHVGPDA